MIDKKLIANDLEETIRRLGRKGVTKEQVLEAHEILLKIKELQTDIDNARSNVNSLSGDIGKLMSSGNKVEAEKVKSSVHGLKAKINSLTEDQNLYQEKFDYIYLRLPNFPAENAPDGLDEANNVVLRSEDYNEDDYKDKTYKPHWELASDLNIFDPERASKISGSMFSLLKGQGSQLLRALVNFGLDLNRDTYLEVTPPHFVNTETFTATGHLPKFEFDAYKVHDEELWAIPTGEVPLMGLHRNEILDYDELPKRYTAYTACFRREAGSAGKDTRGMQRLHEFHKVELLKLCREEQAQEEFENMLQDAERALKKLKLPYRIVDLCAGDLTFSSTRIFDLEVYSPGVDKWLEVSSVGMFGDFQARRGSIRYRDNNKKMQFVHAINGSAMATPRVWAAIIEHNQQEDGSIKVPEALKPYMNCDYIKLN